MAKQDERFIKVLNEGSTWTTNREIWVDKTTGVNYLWIASGNGGGLTPLLGADGKPRALHVEKALDVTLCTPPVKHDFGEHLAQCEYFTVDARNGAFEGVADEKSFVSLLITDGEGTLTSGGETVAVKKGESYFLPAASGPYAVTGTCQTLVTTV